MLISKSISAGWINLDEWSECYLGARHLIQEILINKHSLMPGVEGGISQLVLIASHHLCEVVLFKCIKQSIDSNPGRFPNIEKKFERALFKVAFKEWVEEITGKSFSFSDEPFLSALQLSERRNATVHKESAITDLKMAKSAFYTGVKVSEAIQHHFFPEKSFWYCNVLMKYPIDDDQFFSQIKLLPISL